MTRKKKQQRAFATPARNFVRAIHGNKRGLGGDVRANKIKTLDDALPIPRSTGLHATETLFFPPPLFFFPLLFPTAESRVATSIYTHIVTFTRVTLGYAIRILTGPDLNSTTYGVSRGNDAAPRGNSTVCRVAVGRLHD